MVRLAAGPQTDELKEIGTWSIYGGIAFGIFLTAFFILLGIVYYSAVMCALLGSVALAYWTYLYYGPHWGEYNDEATRELMAKIAELEAANEQETENNKQFAEEDLENQGDAEEEQANGDDGTVANA